MKHSKKYDIDAIAMDYTGGMGAAAIAKKYKVKGGGAYVHSMLRRAGIPPRRKAVNPKPSITRQDMAKFIVKATSSPVSSTAPIVAEWVDRSNGNGILTRLSRIEASLSRLEEVLA